MPYLHELDNFSELLEAVSAAEGIPSAMVEKDYWIMHCLWSLQDQGFDFFLKGGTSLSKGYDIIHRFSEDIDILIVPPQDMNIYTSKNHTKDIHIKSRRVFFDSLLQRIKIPGINKVEYDPSVPQDEKARNADILLHYESKADEQVEKLKEAVLLEVGFDDVEPCTEKTISSWMTEHARRASLDFEDTRALKVKCYNPEYTFVEKLQAVSTKFRQQQETGEMPRNFLRHYYDLYKLLELKEVQDFIGTDEYMAHKKKRFRGKDEKDLTKNEAFIMSDPETRSFYIEKYQEGSALYYKDQPPLEEIIDRLAKILPDG